MTDTAPDSGTPSDTERPEVEVAAFVLGAHLVGRGATLDEALADIREKSEARKRYGAEKLGAMNYPHGNKEGK